MKRSSLVCLLVVVLVAALSLVGAQLTIDLGPTPNSGLGDTLRDGGDKINRNFTNVFERIGALEVSTNITALSADHFRQDGAGTFYAGSTNVAGDALRALQGLDTSITIQQQFSTKLANTNGSAYGLILPDVTLGALTYRNAGDGTIDGSAISNTTLEGALAGYNTGAGSIEQRLVSGATAGGVYVGSYALLAASSYATNTATVRIIVSNSPPVLGDLYAGEYVNTRPGTIVTNADYSLIQSTVDTDVVWVLVDSLDEAPDLQRSLLLDTSYSSLSAGQVEAYDGNNWVNLKPYFRSVEEFGAVSGSDVTVPLQTTLDAVAAAGGGTVYIPPGSWPFTNSIYIGDNTRLVNAGNVYCNWSGVDTNSIDHFFQGTQTTNTITYGANGVVNATNNVNIAIECVGAGVFDGKAPDSLQPVYQTSGSTLYRAHLFKFSGVSNLVFRNAYLRDATRFAISIGGCDNVLVSGCVVDTGNGVGSTIWNGKNQDGVHFNDSWNVRAIGNRVSSSDDAFAFGLNATNSSAGNFVLANNIIDLNLIQSSDGGGNTNYVVGAYGLRMISESGVSTANTNLVRNIVVANNIIKCGAGAFHIGTDGDTDGFHRFRNVLITGNRIYDQTNSVDQVTSPPSATLNRYATQFIGVKGLTFQDNVLDNLNGYPMRFYDTDGVTVAGNQFLNLATNVNLSVDLQAAIRVESNQGTNTNVRIVRNLIDSPVGPAIYGLIGSKKLENIEILRNVIRNASSSVTDTNLYNAAAAIYLQAPSGRTVVEDNRIESPNFGGIAFTGDLGGDFRIRGNYIKDAGVSNPSTTCLYIADDSLPMVERLEVSGNWFEGSGGRTMTLDDIEKPYVFDNYISGCCQTSATEAVQFVWGFDVADGQGVVQNNVASVDPAHVFIRATQGGNAYAGDRVEILGNRVFGGGLKGVSNAPDAFDQAPENSSLFLNQTTDLYALQLLNTSSATSDPLAYFVHRGGNHGVNLDIDTTLASSFQGLRVFTDNAQTNSSLMRVWNNSTSSTRPALEVKSTGTGTGAGILIDHDNSSNSLRVDQDVTSTASQQFAVWIDSDVAGGGGQGGGIDVSQLATGLPVLSVANDTTAGADATIDGRIAVLIGGTVKYVRIYSD